MKNLTECQKILLVLKDNGGWVKGCTIGGKRYKGFFIGSEAKRRLLELYEAGKVYREYEKGFVIYRYRKGAPKL